MDGNRVSGSTMQDAFEENQSKLHEQSGRSFEPQNDIQRRVAEQRSENEHKINESAGEIGKKQSTVQTSSDILKGESLNANSTFQIHRKEAEIDQQNASSLMVKKKRKLEGQIAGIKEKNWVGGGMNKR